MEFVMSLKDLVQDIHTKAENEAFAKLLMSGDINPTQYATYLFNQEAAYRAVEAQADKHGILDDIPEIRRAEKIKEDFKTVRFMRVIRPEGTKFTANGEPNAFSVLAISEKGGLLSKQRKK